MDENPQEPVDKIVEGRNRERIKKNIWKTGKIEIEVRVKRDINK